MAAFGISAQDIVYLFDKFPELRLLMSGKQADLSPETLLKLAFGAVVAAIAAGTGSAGDKQAEAVAARLGLGDSSICSRRPLI